MSETEQATRWVLFGRVQGVGFRWFVSRRATRLGLVGWARNLADGSVEIVASGPSMALAELDRDLRDGPRLSRVDHVEMSEYQHDISDARSFDIK